MCSKPAIMSIPPLASNTAAQRPRRSSGCAKILTFPIKRGQASSGGVQRGTDVFFQQQSLERITRINTANHPPPPPCPGGKLLWVAMAMAAPLMQTFKVGDSLGAAYAGNIAGAIFYGVTNVQTYTYFKRCPEDGIYTKLLIAFLWLLNTLHLMFICNAIWTYAITNFSNPLAILHPTWSVMVTALSDVIVRGIFCRRVWTLSDHNRLLTGSIFLVSLFCCAMTTVFTVRGMVLGSYSDWPRISWVLYLTLISGMVADILLAAVQAVLLKRQRDGMIKTDSTIRVLMLYTINTGAITSICSICCLIIYAATPPGNFLYFGFYSVLPTLLLNALLGTLNARKGLRKGLLGDGRQNQEGTFAMAVTETVYDDSSPKISPNGLSALSPGGRYRQVFVSTEQDERRMELARWPTKVTDAKGVTPAPQSLAPNRYSQTGYPVVPTAERPHRPLPTPIEKDAGPVRLSQ
ncbi:hypothetical protein OBBRIDRAFT_619041 [Obba rivulosa]|uniref:DUF6534 domain-containing protein n=1 Tax=Obba rivulosa TaxID=1052685 RepID=A0A8E2DLT2_9APHY|nr:hypothetical protein OBBRIDRAFT_619041 [Obba rivulosa]